MAGKMLGIMVTQYENLEHIAGVVKAAHAAGHPIMIFLTDEGVKFTRDPKFLELLKVDGIEISVCDHSCERTGIHDKTEGISYGSQYNNAGMLHDSERVLIF
jgi:sulfur relay (sulfurtransferase) complex TusBCD TusD component (DsrE family)